MKNSGFKKAVYVPPAPAPIRPLESPPNYGRNTAMAPVPKRPALRNQYLRDLARGEECSVKIGGACACQPETVVWAHTNTLADQKGLGYKASDEQGFFAGHECHTAIDARKLSPEAVDLLVITAQLRTRERLREIADSYSAPQWKQKAAMWALTNLERKP
jgi:hypothetical protein